MKKILVGGMIACLVAVAAIAGIVIYRHPEVQNTAEPEEKREGRQRVDPAEFEKDEIDYVVLSSHNEGGEMLEDISLWLYPGEEEARIDNETIKLNEEQSDELRQLILQYSQTIKEKEDEYWPHTSEYPDMLVLFYFDMRGEKKQYKADGALCYPDGWEEFIEDLKEIVL